MTFQCLQQEQRTETEMKSNQKVSDTSHDETFVSNHLYMIDSVSSASCFRAALPAPLFASPQSACSTQRKWHGKRHRCTSQQGFTDAAPLGAEKSRRDGGERMDQLSWHSFSLFFSFSLSLFLCARERERAHSALTRLKVESVASTQPTSGCGKESMQVVGN